MQTKKMCLTKICFNHEQERISPVFLTQVSVFQIVCFLFNTDFFSNGSYNSEIDKFFCSAWILEIDLAIRLTLSRQWN